MGNNENLLSTENLPSTIVNEVTTIGNAYRRLIDKAAKLWLRISYWTHARDVEFDDGKTAQEKVGNINGITSDFNLVDEDIASSILPVHNVTVKTNKIKENLDKGIINDHIQFVIDSNGNLGWKKDGADAVIPFSSIFVMTTTRRNPDPTRYMCYACCVYHHASGGKGRAIFPKSSNMYGSMIYNMFALPSGRNQDLPEESDYNFYLWGPLNTKDYY